MARCRQSLMKISQREIQVREEEITIGMLGIDRQNFDEERYSSFKEFLRYGMVNMDSLPIVLLS
jgi:hypothetical protein